MRRRCTLRENEVNIVPTQDHREIYRWAARFGAIPAEIRRSKSDGEPSILYFLFGDLREGTPESKPISWDDFFARFDLLGLSLAYDEQSPQFHLVRVDRVLQPGLAN